MNYGRIEYKNPSKILLWKASARRLGQSQAYNQMLFNYPRGRVSFKSEEKTSQGRINRLNQAIRIRINGHLEKTGDNSIFRRMGSLWIHNHAVEEFSEVAGEIEGISKYELYIGRSKKLRVNVLRNRDRAVVYIIKNWINPLHNSLLPGINEALEKAESILKRKQHVKTVWKILFTQELEKKGQKTLDFELSNGIKHYPLPYISPRTLDAYVKKHTDVDIRMYYPAEESWNSGIKNLLQHYLMKLLGKVKKKAKATSIYLRNWLKRQITPLSHTTSGRKGREGKGGVDSEVYSYKPPPAPIFEPPPPSFSSLLEDKRELNIIIPEDSLKFRVATFKKRAKNGIVRTYTKNIFYKVHRVEEETPFSLRNFTFNKHFIVNPRAYRLIHGLERTLNNCIYAIMNYRPRTARKEALRLRALKSHKREMLRIQ